MITLIFANDHAGYVYKTQLIDVIYHSELITDVDNTKNISILDMGCNTKTSVDYPDYIHPAVNKLNELNKLATDTGSGDVVYGIFICGSGNGVSMTANKYSNIRAGLCWNETVAELTRKHNNANVLCLPARYVSQVDARKILLTFINTEFEGGRHSRRVNNIPCK